MGGAEVRLSNKPTKLEAKAKLGTLASYLPRLSRDTPGLISLNMPPVYSHELCSAYLLSWSGLG